MIRLRLKMLRCLVIAWQSSILNVLSGFEKHGKSNHCHVMQYFYLNGLSPTNIKAKLDSTGTVCSFVCNSKLLGRRV